MKMKHVILPAIVLAVMGTSGVHAQTTKDSSATQQQSSTQSAASQPAAASGTVLQAISASGYNTMLSNVIKTAGLESTLTGAGPYTVFAPSDQAFTGLTAADSLLKDPSKLTPLIRHHIVSGTYTKDDIIKALTVGKGSTTLKTIDGSTLTLKVNASKNLELSDPEGHTALVTVFDLKGTNGVAHVINGILGSAK